MNGASSGINFLGSFNCKQISYSENGIWREHLVVGRDPLQGL
jgi:hypothetical protein